MKIYAKNKQYNGISAGVTFVNGVGETDIPHIIEWFEEHGYTLGTVAETEDKAAKNENENEIFTKAIKKAKK